MKKDQAELKNIAELPPTIQQIRLAAFLSSKLLEHSMKLTVVGGAAVQYYTDAEYVTGDLDAIIAGEDSEIVAALMYELGFKRTSSYRHFEHPDLPFVVEFPPSPIEIGNRIISQVNTLKLEDWSVRILRVEDIIMDRIIAAVEWKDEPSLEQAKMLWLKNQSNIDRHYLEDFAKKEGYLKTLREIMKL